MIANYLYRNPRLLVLAVGIIVTAGLAALHVLPRMEDPVLTRRVGLVTTTFPGADARNTYTSQPRPHPRRRQNHRRRCRCRCHRHPSGHYHHCRRFHRCRGRGSPFWPPK